MAAGWLGLLDLSGVVLGTTQAPAGGFVGVLPVVGIPAAAEGLPTDPLGGFLSPLMIVGVPDSAGAEIVIEVPEPQPLRTDYGTGGLPLEIAGRRRHNGIDLILAAAIADDDSDWW